MNILRSILRAIRQKMHRRRYSEVVLAMKPVRYYRLDGREQKEE